MQIKGKKAFSNFDINESVVSFDIFDTLVRRLVYEPHQVFSILAHSAKDKGYNLPENFVELRIEAERVANRKCVSASIYEIYDKLAAVDEETKKLLLDLEVQMEIELCVPNPEALEIFQRCVDEHKKVILISDMYLTAELIKKILDNCKIKDNEKIFVSCDYRATKSRGSLFKIVFDELGIEAKELAHIGDNKKSDYMVPKSIGIHALHYDPANIISKEKAASTTVKNLNAFCTNQLLADYSKSGMAFQIGYSSFGPLLYGFTQWLMQRFEEDKIEKVYFLSRDGLIMQRAYKAMGGKIENEYLYASRRALIVPTLMDYIDEDEVFSRFFTSSRDTVGSLVEKLGLTVESCRVALERHDLSSGDAVDLSKEDKKSFLGFYKEIKDRVFENSQSQANLLKRYLDEVNFSGRIAIVDIGWHGNMQRALAEIAKKYNLNVEMKGYYLGVIPNSTAVNEGKIDATGYLFEKGREEMFRYEKHFCSFIEYIFSAAHGSVIGYKSSDGSDIAPVFGKYEYSEEMMTSDAPLPVIHNENEALKSIQDAALDFIRDIKAHPSFLNQDFKPEDWFDSLKLIGTNPSKAEMNFIGDLRYYVSDRDVCYIARPQKLSYYMLHPKRLKRELLLECGWRIGFLNRLFKVPFPYAKAYFWARNVNGKQY